MNPSDLLTIQNILSTSPKIAEEIAAMSAFKEYTAGSLISAPGTIDNKGMFLKEGVVKYSYTSLSGNETIFRISKAPLFMPYTIVGFCLNEESATSCTCVTDIKGYEIGSNRLFSLMDKYPQLYEFFFSTVLFSHQLLQSKEIDILQNDSTERYNQFVKSFSDVIKSIPLKDIASYLNIHPGSLSRIRKKV